MQFFQRRKILKGIGIGVSALFVLPTAYATPSKEEITVNFETAYIENSDIPEGVTIVKREGKPGKNFISRRKEAVLDKNGEKSYIEVTEEKVEFLPVTQLVVVGTKKDISGTHDKIISEEQEKKALEEKQKRAKVSVAPPKNDIVISGSKKDWMTSAGIPESDWGYVDKIVTRESGWNPLAVNKSSGACGLAQALPCSKIPGDWRDPVTALKWQYGYVTARYGGYKGAVEHSNATGWY